MKSRNLLKVLYLFLLFLLIFPKTNAELELTETLSNLLGLDIDLSFLILLISLFFILFFILQKGTQKLFGNTTVANIIAFLISLVAVVFMPEELFTFLANWAVIIVALAFIIAPITLIRLFNIQNKKAKHIVLILMYIVMIWTLSKLHYMDNFKDIFDAELPFIFGETELINIAYWALAIAIIVSAIVIIIELTKSSRESYSKRLEELKIKAETAKNIAEQRKYINEIKNK